MILYCLYTVRTHFILLPDDGIITITFTTVQLHILYNIMMKITYRILHTDFIHVPNYRFIITLSPLYEVIQFIARRNFFFKPSLKKIPSFINRHDNNNNNNNITLCACTKIITMLPEKKHFDAFTYYIIC